MINIAVVDFAGYIYRRLDHQAELLGLQAIDALNISGEGGVFNLSLLADCDFLVVVSDPESDRQLSDSEIRILKGACLAEKTEMMLLSSMAVFPPAEEHRWHEDEPVAPSTDFGRYCVRLEQQFSDPMLTVLRTSWLFDLEGAGWFSLMLSRLEQGETISAPTDYSGNPTSYDDISRVILAVIRQLFYVNDLKLRGRYHYAGQEPVTMHRFFQVIINETARFRDALPGSLESTLLGDWNEPCHFSAHSQTEVTRLMDRFGIKPRLWVKEVTRQLNFRYSGKS